MSTDQQDCEPKAEGSFNQQTEASFVQTYASFQSLFLAKKNKINAVLSMMGAEAKLSLGAIMWTLGLGVLLFVVFIFAWILINFIIAYFIHALTLSILGSALALLVLNTLIALYLVARIKYLWSMVGFSTTISAVTGDV